MFLRRGLRKAPLRSGQQLTLMYILKVPASTSQRDSVIVHSYITLLSGSLKADGTFPRTIENVNYLCFTPPTVTVSME